MLLNLKNLPLVENRQGLTFLPSGKLLINTINAHSYNTAQQDLLFAEALQGCVAADSIIGKGVKRK